MIICLKCISEECFSFNVNNNASLKFLKALGWLLQYTHALGHSEVTWTLIGHLDTCALGGHSKGTLAPKTLRHSSTCSTRALGHLGHLVHSDACALENFYLADSSKIM